MPHADQNRVTFSADVDVDAIMREIRAEIERKRAAGVYPPDLLTDLDLASVSAGHQIDDEGLARALADLRRSSGFSPDVTAASRKPVIAPLVSGFKRAIRAAIRWYMTGVLHQISTFAGYAARVANLLAARIEALDARVTASGEQTAARMDEIGQRLDTLDRRLAEIEKMDVSPRLARLDRALRDVREGAEGAGTSPAGPAQPSAEPHASVGSRSWAAERALDYFAFESHFRGSVEEIAQRQGFYVDLFRDSPGVVVDLGFGRGEFLRLLSEAGIHSYGVDRHPDMVSFAAGQGLDVRQGEALAHLASARPASIGGIFCAQMIEHLDPPDVVRFFEVAAEALAPGGTLVVETINPRSLFVFAHAFYVDLGHLRPLHPLTLEFLARSSGFSQVRVEYLSPPPPEFRPQPLPDGPEPVRPIVEQANENFRRIDEIVFGPQDYAIVARR